MSGKPAATLGSHHTCPMCSGTTPHIGGPIIQGAPNVLINGNPVATIGSVCTCAGGPDTVVTGNPTVLINGKAIACLGDMTAHGGVIVSGSANVIVSSSAPEPPRAVMPIDKIPFPEITFLDRIKAGLVG
ncbi:PAAR domain-containing protein [Tamlana sp. s12]|nr:PAAR domain-containing protein [Tamlana sp. s12]QQY82862.1 PAAR domain-containing protein [Tamlana sp. s12]